MSKSKQESAPKRLVLNPISQLREIAVSRVDALINDEATGSVHKDHEYRLKQDIAKRVLADPSSETPFEFAEEARLMGISTFDLAMSIDGKSDPVLHRGLRRRRANLAIKRATSEDEINGIINALMLSSTRTAETEKKA